MHQHSDRRKNSQCRCVLDRVIRLYEFDFERTCLDSLSELYDLSSGLVQKSLFLELVVYKTHSKLCGIDRGIYLSDDIWNGSDMVLMSVGYEKSLDFFFILDEICDVRDAHVDPEHVVFRECESTVYHDYGIPVLKSCHIHADLLETAQWYDFKMWFLMRFHYTSCNSSLKTEKTASIVF